MKKLVIYKYAKKGANGDRASHSNTPYFDYELKYGDFVIHTISGYDNWYTMVLNNQVSVERNMHVYALQFADAFDLPEPETKLMEKQSILMEEWVEIE